MIGISSIRRGGTKRKTRTSYIGCHISFDVISSTLASARDPFGFPIKLAQIWEYLKYHSDIIKFEGDGGEVTWKSNTSPNIVFAKISNCLGEGIRYTIEKQKTEHTLTPKLGSVELRVGNTCVVWMTGWVYTGINLKPELDCRQVACILGEMVYFSQDNPELWMKPGFRAVSGSIIHVEGTDDYFGYPLHVIARLMQISCKNDCILINQEPIQPVRFLRTFPTHAYREVNAYEIPL